ncbi:MAG TPA: aldehyde dehydrogenase family protein [Candidatus Copromorpha excrementigallinarum]|uniref:Aldehyde dehydrogenase family protein n=1 Tax=Candidatus Allocopromorpha excrementigallinarum TaxID=2840742 RepID=A0A9D1I140_9FIRM|nr:aldehyde dehydrogenase family protein [Candidatus Copromorpha excrementigallinarum]
MAMSSHDYVAGLVAKGKAAQEIANGFTQEDVDLLTSAVAYTLTKPENARKYCEMLVEESGMGIVEDKIAKLYGKVKGAYIQMKDEQSVGCLERNEATGMEKWAKPMGVVAGIMPVTNGEATPIVKANMALKTRNAIILAPHPKARKTNETIVAQIRAVIKKLGYPEDLVQAVEPEMVNLETSKELMKQCDFILATGGEALVEQAYSSGTPAIGVGVGNTISIVDGSTDMNKVAEMIVRSKAFDNATSCSTENNIIVFESCYDEFVKAMAEHGAVLFKEGSDEKAKLQKAMWPNTPNDHVLNRAIVAQNAEKIAEIAGLDVPAGTKVLMAEELNGFGLDHPFTGEKLSPVSGIQKAKDFDDALDKLLKTLDYMGKGHSCGIHTSNKEYVDRLAAVVPVTKVVVNQPQCLTNSGGWNCGFPVSMTLGCATWGGNSISHNATWKDLLNFTYVSREIPSWQPDDAVLFPQELRDKVDK